MIHSLNLVKTCIIKVNDTSLNVLPNIQSILSGYNQSILSGYNQSLYNDQQCFIPFEDNELSSKCFLEPSLPSYIFSGIINEHIKIINNPIPSEITNLTTLVLKGTHIYYECSILGKRLSLLDPNLLTRFVNLEKLTLTGFIMTGTTDFLSSFQHLKSLSLNVEIKRGNLPLPLMEEIIDNTSIVPKFWKIEDFNQQTNLKRLLWDTASNFRIHLRLLRHLNYYSDKFFDPYHFDSTASEYKYDFISNVHRKSLDKLIYPHINKLIVDNEILYQRPIRDDDEPLSEDSNESSDEDIESSNEDIESSNEDIESSNEDIESINNIDTKEQIKFSIINFPITSIVSLNQ
jgi:hypothetical protein